MTLTLILFPSGHKIAMLRHFMVSTTEKSSADILSLQKRDTDPAAPGSGHPKPILSKHLYWHTDDLARAN